jgi:hypothetical protein
LCAAYENIVEIAIDAKQWPLARRVAEAAIATRDCDTVPFERLLVRVAERKG